MTSADDAPIRVLELRSVWGTGGGPEKTILLGAAQSDPRHFAVTVCYIRDERDPVFGIDAKAAGLDIDYVEVRERSSLDWRIIPALRQIVRDRRIDIVHAHEYKTDLVALVLAKLEGVVPLATVHGWTGHSGRERVYYAVDKWLLARYPRLVAVSEDIRQELIRRGSRAERVATVLNGIDHRAFRRDPARVAAARAHFGLAPDWIVVGAVGRLEPQKRFDLLFEAIARLRAAEPRLRCVVAGEGSVRADLEGHIRRLGLEDICRLLGQQADVGLVHHAIDLFVQSSDYEGTPNAVLEAMAFESPTVATSAGGTAELMHSDVHGLIVPIGDVDALVTGITRLVAEPETARARARAARARVEGDLSFEQRMRRVEAIYQALCSRGAPRSAAGEYA